MTEEKVIAPELELSKTNKELESDKNSGAKSGQDSRNSGSELGKHQEEKTQNEQEINRLKQGVAMGNSKVAQAERGLKTTDEENIDREGEKKKNQKIDDEQRLADAKSDLDRSQNELEKAEQKKTESEDSKEKEQNHEFNREEEIAKAQAVLDAIYEDNLEKTGRGLKFVVLNVTIDKDGKKLVALKRPTDEELDEAIGKQNGGSNGGILASINRGLASINHRFAKWDEEETLEKWANEKEGKFYEWLGNLIEDDGSKGKAGSINKDSSDKNDLNSKLQNLVGEVRNDLKEHVVDKVSPSDPTNLPNSSNKGNSLGK